MVDILQAYIDNMNSKMQKERSTEYFTLGKLISELEKLNQDAHVRIQPYGLNPAGFESYRGYYCDLALDYDMEYGPTTVADVLKWAKDAVNKEFIGWKGGEFLMNKNTPLWISQFGKSSNMRLARIEPLGDRDVYLWGEYVKD